MNGVTYTISLDNLTQHLLTVECVINRPNPDGQIIAIPSWIPGSYMVRNLAKHVVSIKAHHQDMPVAVTKIDSDSWQCTPCNGPLIITYQVYGFDIAPRAAYIDSTRVFFDGCRVFLDVRGNEEQDCIVIIKRPLAAYTRNWRCITSMSPLAIDAEGYGSYTAANHLELIDHPFEISNFQQFTFDVADTPHYLVIPGNIPADYSRLISDAQKICVQHVKFFGELPAMPMYLFILHAINKGYGGIEHRNSTSLLCGINNLPILGAEEKADDYISLLGLISHEYFHLWNVKRIKPEVFTGMDLYRVAYTRQLWIFEGITSYYDNLALVSSNVISVQEYLKILQKEITQIQQNPGSYVQSLADSSFDAWTKFYQPDENSANSSVSYYTKGSLVALALDLKIINSTSGQQSLADVMQILWQQYGKSGIGLPEGYFERIVFEVTGEDYSIFFAEALDSTVDLNLSNLLATVGVEFTNKPASLLDNYGIRLYPSNDNIIIRSVLNNTVCEQAGLAPFDTIIAINNYAVNQANLESVIRRCASDASPYITCHVFRNDILLQLEIQIPTIVNNVCELKMHEQIGAQQLQLRAKWINYD